MMIISKVRAEKTCLLRTKAVYRKCILSRGSKVGTYSASLNIWHIIDDDK